MAGYLWGEKKKGPTQQELDKKKIREQHATIQQLKRQMATNKRLQMERDMQFEQQCIEKYNDKLNEEMKAIRISQSAYEQKLQEMESNVHKKEFENKIASLKATNDKHLKKITDYYNEISKYKSSLKEKDRKIEQLRKQWQNINNENKKLRDDKENSTETRDLQKKVRTLTAENERSNDLLQNERKSRQQVGK